jgi:WD40 repeat protein
MKRISLVLLALVFIYPAIIIGAEKDSISLNLVWEKEIPQGVKDFVFLDENGYNVFSVQCKDSEKALKEKRLLMVQGNKLVWYEGDAMRVVKEMAIGKGSSNENKVVISKNGRNIAILNGLYTPTIKDKDYDEYKGTYRDQLATLRLLNWKGEELARTQFSPGHLDYITIFPLGDDSTIVMNFEGSEGYFSQMNIYRRSGSLLNHSKSFNDLLWDYSEDGQRMIGVVSGEMTILSNDGIIKASYHYRPLRKVWISPTGKYVAQLGAGKYIGIFNNRGKIISEHHVQGQGNYYGAFSPDEKYLCITPGPWRVYLFENKTGKMIWDYTELNPDSFSFFFSPIVSNKGIVFIGSSKWNPLSVLSSAKSDKTIYLLNNWHPTPLLRITPDGQYLMVRLPSKLQLYNIIRGGKYETN